MRGEAKGIGTKRQNGAQRAKKKVSPILYFVVLYCVVCGMWYTHIRDDQFVSLEII